MLYHIICDLIPFNVIVYNKGIPLFLTVYRSALLYRSSSIYIPYRLCPCISDQRSRPAPTSFYLTVVRRGPCSSDLSRYACTQTYRPRRYPYLDVIPISTLSLSRRYPYLDVILTSTLSLSRRYPYLDIILISTLSLSRRYPYLDGVALM